MIALILICILFFLLGTITTLFSICAESRMPIILAVVFFILFGIFIEKLDNYTEIKPIDIYRGKTTLRITYEDGIPTDTIVVFKNK